MSGGEGRRRDAAGRVRAADAVQPHDEGTEGRQPHRPPRRQLGQGPALHRAGNDGHAGTLFSMLVVRFMLKL